MNIDDLIATAQPRTQLVRICARGDLVAAHAEAVEALGRVADDETASLGDPATRDAAAAVIAVEEEMDAATVTFTVASVSRQVWNDLLAAHPPSKEQRRAGHDHDPATFPVAAVAACVSDPEITLDQAKKLVAALPAGEWNKLWVAALSLNITETPHPKLAAATELLRVNGQSSTTSGNGASPEEGSLAGSGVQ